MEDLDMQQHWDSLVVASGIDVDLAQIHFNDLCRAYSEPHRYYHTLAHVNQMLRLLEKAANDDVAALWAAWYHDYVYKPGQKDNEARSGIQARVALSELGIDSSVVAKVVRMIEATKDHKLEGIDDRSLRLVLDADMAILGVQQEHYAQYCKAVRMEFKSIPELLYRRGRKRFLQSVLKQDKIFYSQWFYEEFEVRARENIESELSELKY